MLLFPALQMAVTSKLLGRSARPVAPIPATGCLPPAPAPGGQSACSPWPRGRVGRSRGCSRVQQQGKHSLVVLLCRFGGAWQGVDALLVRFWWVPRLQRVKRCRVARSCRHCAWAGILSRAAAQDGQHGCLWCLTLQSHADGRALMRQCDELLAFLKELDAAQLATAAAQRRKEQLHE